MAAAMACACTTDCCMLYGQSVVALSDAARPHEPALHELSAVLSVHFADFVLDAMCNLWRCLVLVLGVLGIANTCHVK